MAGGGLLSAGPALAGNVPRSAKSHWALILQIFSPDASRGRELRSCVRSRGEDLGPEVQCQHVMSISTRRAGPFVLGSALATVMKQEIAGPTPPASSTSHTSAPAVVASRNGLSGAPSSAHPPDDPSNWPRPPASLGPIARGLQGVPAVKKKTRVSGPIILPRSTVFFPLRLRCESLIGRAVETLARAFWGLVGAGLALAGTVLLPSGPSGGARRTDGRRASPPQRTGSAGVISPQRRHRKSAPLSEGLICQARQRALVTLGFPCLPNCESHWPLRLSPWILGVVKARTVSLTIVGLLQVVLSLAPDAATRRNIGRLVLATASPWQHHSPWGSGSTRVAHYLSLWRRARHARSIRLDLCLRLVEVCSVFWRGNFKACGVPLRGNIAPAYCTLAATRAWNLPPLNPIPHPLSLPLPRHGPV